MQTCFRGPGIAMPGLCLLTAVEILPAIRTCLRLHRVVPIAPSKGAAHAKENSMTTLDTRFIPADFDATVWSNIEPLFEALLSRSIETADEFETWLIDRSELDAVCNEAQANLYISMT